MKRVLFVLAIFAAPLLSRGQDSTAAVSASLSEIQENYKILKGNFDNLRETADAQAKRITELEGEIRDLRAAASKPAGNFVSKDDLKPLQEGLEAVKKKQQADNEEVLKEFKDLAKQLGKTTAAASASTTHSSTNVSPTHSAASTPRTEDGYVYEVKSGDYPAKIAKHYVENGITVTAQQIKDANPDVKDWAKLVVGQKLFIPAPKTSPTSTANK